MPGAISETRRRMSQQRANSEAIVNVSSAARTGKGWTSLTWGIIHQFATTGRATPRNGDAPDCELRRVRCLRALGQLLRCETMGVNSPSGKSITGSLGPSASRGSAWEACSRKNGQSVACSGRRWRLLVRRRTVLGFSFGKICRRHQRRQVAGSPMQLQGDPFAVRSRPSGHHRGRSRRGHASVPLPLIPAHQRRPGQHRGPAF